MEHIYWVTEGRLAGRCGPMKAPWKPQSLKSLGIGGVVSLAEGVCADDLVTAGLKHLPVCQPMILLESEHDRQQFLTIMPEVLKFVDELHQADLAVLVHCYHGFDRTGAILASILIARSGMSAAEAIAHIRQTNPFVMSAYGYAEAVATFEDLYRRNRALFETSS